MGKTSRGNLQILSESLIGKFPRSIKVEFYIPGYEILLIPLSGWGGWERKKILISLKTVITRLDMTAWEIQNPKAYKEH